MPLFQNLPGHILDNLSTAVILVDTAYHVTFMNPAAEELFGTSMASQLDLETVFVDGGPYSTLLACLQHRQTGGQSYTYREITIKPSSREAHTVNCTITPLHDLMYNGGGQLVEMSLVDRILRIAQEEQLMSQHLTAREIARGLAHEINNPLGGLRGAAQLLERELPEKSREYTQIIISEADRLQSLVKNMLGPSSLPNKTSINIHEVLNHVITLIGAEAGADLQIALDYDPSIPNISADRDQLIQAILNLVRNAWQATGAGGRIRLRTRIVRSFTIGHTFHRLVLRIEVIDNGPGIPPHKLKQIFYPMVTGRPEGSGLGLTIAQSLISLHGGLIECNSSPGETNFSILLPFANTSEGD
ncbi:MAG TPA: nitrogen regulation protein NR(II) [Gammaproteobacteria bacterium]